MGLIEIEEFLKQTVGLNPFVCGAAVIERAVRERMNLTRTSDWETYCLQLKRSPGELRSLAEAVLEPHTWFLRDRDAFSALRRFAIAHRPDGSAPKPLRVLCVPAGRGEEAFSVVMSLLECGLTPGQFKVHAVDLRANPSARSKARVFGCSSFHDGEAEMRRRYFEATPDGFTANQTVQEAVTFHPGNPLTGTWPATRGGFDVIFCRRFLSCFSSSAQEKLVRKLGRLLSPGGLLFVAPTEVSLLRRHAFDPRKIATGYAAAATPNLGVPDAGYKKRLPVGPLTSTPQTCSKNGKGHRHRQSERAQAAVAAVAAGNGRA